MVDIAKAKFSHPGKDEDDHLVRALDGGGWLLAVADGLSMSGGRMAAQSVIEILNHVDAIDTARSVFEQLRSRLVSEGDDQSESETTVTCGLLKEVRTSEATLLRFEFFAIGDSPIWKVVRAPDGSRYLYQRYLVHGSPYPAETAKVYSTVRIHRKVVAKGPVSFGSVDILDDEVLVICTDGIPEREVFVRDQSQQSLEFDESLGLCKWLFQGRPYDDAGIQAILDAYNARGLLYDDATIIAARVGVPRQAATTDSNLMNEGNKSLPSDVCAILQTSCELNSPSVNDVAGNFPDESSQPTEVSAPILTGGNRVDADSLTDVSEQTPVLKTSDELTSTQSEDAGTNAAAKEPGVTKIDPVDDATRKGSQPKKEGKRKK